MSEGHVKIYYTFVLLVLLSHRSSCSYYNSNCFMFYQKLQGTFALEFLVENVEVAYCDFSWLACDLVLEHGLGLLSYLALSTNT